MDYDQVIANAVKGVNPLISGSLPPLSTGQPLVPQDNLRDVMSRAMVPEFTPTGEDRSTAMAKIGMSLMQPRMPGESNVGNIGRAANVGIDYLDQAKQRQQTQAIAQATLGSQVRTADVQARQGEMNLQKMAQQYPMEVAELQEKLKQLTLEGKTKEYQAIVAAVKADPGRVLREINADLKLKEAQAGAQEAHGRFWDKYGNYLEQGKPAANQRQNMHTNVLDDGRQVTDYMVNGKMYHEILTPGVSDMTKATKLAEKMLKAEKSYGWFGGPTPQEIQTRAQELMQPKVTTINHMGQSVQPPAEGGTPASSSTTPTPTVGQPEQVGGPTDTGLPTESPADARAAATRSADVIQSELAAEKDPAKKEVLQREFDRAKLIASSDNPHTVGRAKNPASVAQPVTQPTATRTGGVEVWTPEKIDQTLGKAPTGTGSTPKPPEEDVLPHERGARAMQTPMAAGKPVGVAEIRAILQKPKHNAGELLALESYKDSDELMPLERTKIAAALKRGKLQK